MIKLWRDIEKFEQSFYITVSMTFIITNIFFDYFFLFKNVDRHFFDRHKSSSNFLLF